MGKRWPLSPDMALDVIAREKSCCAVCGLPVDNGHIHHRKPRGFGGGPAANTMSNLLYLHPSCHLQHVEQRRNRAYDNGWLLQMWQEPQDTPLMYMLNGMVYLTDDGKIVEREQGDRNG